MQKTTEQKMTGKQKVLTGVLVLSFLALTLKFGPAYFNHINEKSFPPQGQLSIPPASKFTSQPLRDSTIMKK